MVEQWSTLVENNGRAFFSFEVKNTCLTWKSLISFNFFVGTINNGLEWKICNQCRIKNFAVSTISNGQVPIKEPFMKNKIMKILKNIQVT